MNGLITKYLQVNDISEKNRAKYTPHSYFSSFTIKLSWICFSLIYPNRFFATTPTTAQKMMDYGFLQHMWPNPLETVDLVTFTEEILNGKLHFLGSVQSLNLNSMRNLELQCRIRELIWPHRFLDDCFLQRIHSNIWATARLVAACKDEVYNTPFVYIILKQIL